MQALPGEQCDVSESGPHEPSSFWCRSSQRKPSSTACSVCAVASPDGRPFLPFVAVAAAREGNAEDPPVSSALPEPPSWSASAVVVNGDDRRASAASRRRLGSRQLAPTGNAAALSS